MNVQEPDDIVAECFSFRTSIREACFGGGQTPTAAQSLTGTNMALYTRINSLLAPRQFELVKMLEENLHASDRLLARNIRLGKKRRGGKVNGPEVKAS
jgi:hypothetical protein